MSRRLGTTMAATILLASATALPVRAHLSIIRQGHECAGANEVGDQHGYAVAAGDFNGDGYDDLAMGAVHEDVGTVANAGAVVVSWGSEHGITHVGSTIYTADDMTGSVESFANVGQSLAAGDFNGDGIDDLAVGAPYADGAVNDCGLVYVMRGSAGGLQPWGIVDHADLAFTADLNDQFGFSLAVGNFNLDAYDDLAIGAPGVDLASGMAFYALGSVIGPFDGGFLRKDMFGFPFNQPGDRFGFSVAVGNVVGSAHEDMIIGSPYEDSVTGLQDFGRIYVVPGHSAGVGALGAVMHASPASVQGGERFGFAVAAGDLYGTPYEAVVAGAPGRSVSGHAGAGRVVVMPGGSSDLDLANALFLTQDVTGWTIEGNELFGNAVAVGHFWDDDGFEDLAVGYPGDGYGFTTAAGGVSLIFGGPDGPTGTYGWYGFAQWNLNEFAETSDVLGLSLCFGEFDETNRGNLAVGAPGEDSFAGLVHVIAPWRQVYNLTCERSVAYDCDHNLVFSQKPFDKVKIASTTKIMTVLIACERSQLPASDPLHVDLDTPYTVPAWVANNIPGSQVPLVQGEWMTLEDLMYTCLMLSGNDAANAIADLLAGSLGPNISLPAFVGEMNARASALGMAGSHFHNPAGLDNEPVGPELGEHYSTPYDMGLLSRAAMQNPLFAEIAGTLSRNVARHIFGQNFPWTCNNIFGGVLMNGLEPLNGIKGGSTTGAQVTGCFSAEPDFGGTVIAGTYTTPLNNAGNYAFDAASLIQLGLADCGFIWQIPGDWNPTNPFYIPGIPAGAGMWGGGAGQFAAANGGDRALSLIRTHTDGGDASVRACLTHTAELYDDRDPRFRLGATEVVEHGEIHITNMGEAPAMFEVNLPYDSDSHQLDPGETLTIPGRQLPAAPGFEWEIVGAVGAASRLHLEVEQMLYFDVVMSAEQGTGTAMTATLIRDDDIVSDGMSWITEGLTPGSESIFLIAEHDPGSVVATPEVDTASNDVTAPLFAVHAAAPNPFRTRTSIRFDAQVAGALEIGVYDVGGRRVRSFPARDVHAGRWAMAWDGADDAGRDVAPGTYFVRFALDGAEVASQKVVRVR